ncbi:hypothetical protein G6011_08327 [Alternaria panax]|uniref:Uncharacterized protein n=1 Tax=Alternaria panax TaxID=48097 RepID=A0AAD4FGR2_9PLEO|nr:hypothetical protein G6011_08327 [Alternaria panax]
MAKAKTLVISGPMDAKHVGGVNVLGNGGSSLNNYFPSTAIVPDERPSHTFVAVGRTEVPRRSDTVAGTLRRPSVSLTRSLSRLRRSSSSHRTEVARGAGEEQQVHSQMEISNNTGRPLMMQSSMSRLRQKVGLDRELYDTMPITKTPTPEPVPIPEPVEKDYLPQQDRRALARLTTTSSIYSTPDLDFSGTRIPRKQQPLVIQRRPSPSKPQSPIASAQLPARSKRADSGTAIDFKDVPLQERPIPFKEIMAAPILAERMAMYKKTREYWAHADHGLIAWTEHAAGPKIVTTGP